MRDAKLATVVGGEGVGRADRSPIGHGSSSEGGQMRLSADLGVFLDSTISKAVAFAPVRRGRATDRHERLQIGRELFERGEPCSVIAKVIGYSSHTIESRARSWGWRRVAVSCSRCGTAVPIKERATSQRVCASCMRERYRAKARQARATLSKEARQEERRRYAEKRGKTYAPLAERRLQTAAKPRSPHSELGRFRHYGERPQSRAGALLVIQATLSQLLKARCASEGKSIKAVKYRVWYATDPAFRAKEKAKTAGRKAKREATMQRDGTLTTEVIRRLFATAGICPYCDKLMTGRDKTLDHLTPVSRGGVHGISNVTVCCYACNSRKRDLLFSEWLHRLPAHIAARFEATRVA